MFFAMGLRNPMLFDHARAGGAGTCPDDDGWLVWCSGGDRTRVVLRVVLGVVLGVVQAAELPFIWQGRVRYNRANALAALAALRCMGDETTAVARSLARFVSDAKNNPLRGNGFEVGGVKLIVDHAHNVVAYRALPETARSMLEGWARRLGAVTSPGDRRREDQYETGQVCGLGLDERVAYEQDPRGRSAGDTRDEILRGRAAQPPAGRCMASRACAMRWGWP